MKRICTYVVLLGLSACGLLDKDIAKKVPTVNTGVASAVTSTGFIATGTVTDDGGYPIMERGVVVGIEANPTISDAKFSGGSGKGTFTVSAAGLSGGTSYHYRAYAINKKGIGYGQDEVIITQSTVPVVSTTIATSITAQSAVVGGVVVSEGGGAVQSRGICWSINPSPTILDIKSSNGNGIGEFSTKIEGLRSAQKIYARAYATNAIGTGYGNEIEWTTLSSLPSLGLVGWWPMDGNANDKSGNERHGTLLGSPQASPDRFGASASAYQFKAGLDKMVLNNLNVDLSAGAFNSVSIWVKWSGDFYSQSDLGAFPFFWGVSKGGLYVVANQPFFPSGVNLRLGLNAVASAGETWGISNPSFMINNWVHVVAVFKNAPLSGGLLYVNGVLVDSNLVSGDLSNAVFETMATSSPAVGGTSIDGTYETSERYTFLGLIDDVAIFNRALTAAEVLKIYNGSGF